MQEEEKWRQKIRERLLRIYERPDLEEAAFRIIEEHLGKYEPESGEREPLTQKDAMLITYGDSLTAPGKKGLQTLKRFLTRWVEDAIPYVHLLPMFPYTSDDGFSVVDYRRIREDLGDWNDIQKLSGSYGLMFDAVINHISRESDWFRKFEKQIPPYDQYFIVCDPKADYSLVTRPRALPLLTEVETSAGLRHVWTTFSTDQIDLNYACPDVLAEILDILVFFGKNGARFIRLDAIGFLWKELGTRCMHHPKTHEIVKLIRDVLPRYAPGVRIITETNVPQKENMSYFGEGDEADLIYQFPLPPLTMYTLLTGDAQPISGWLASLEPPVQGGTFFNFLSSHDGIGVRPAEGILRADQVDVLLTATLKNGGRISYKDNGDGTRSPYELNINYQDALASPDDSDEVRIGRFLAAETLLLSLQGMPGIYIHSLLGSRNDYLGLAESDIPRRINREKLDLDALEEQLSGETNRRLIFREMLRRLWIRQQLPPFAPDQPQQVLNAGEHVIAFTRGKAEKLWVLINVSGEEQTIWMEGLQGRDLLSEDHIEIKGRVTLSPYQCSWIQEVKELKGEPFK